jgi:hypothetical protein
MEGDIWGWGKNGTREITRNHAKSRNKNPTNMAEMAGAKWFAKTTPAGKAGAGKAGHRTPAGSGGAGRIGTEKCMKRRAGPFMGR